MSVTNRLIFDVTDADTRAASANVGAHLRAGTDGELIDSTSGALHVLLQNASVTVDQGTSPWVIGDGGGSITVDGTVAATQSGAWSVSITGNVTVDQGTSPWVVSGTQIDIDDLNATDDAVSSWLKDGSGNSITSTAGALNVNIASGSLTISDAALANTAGANAAISVSTSGALVASPLSARKYLYAYNNGSKPVYLGFGTVSAANGFPMYPGQAYEFRAGASIAMNAFAATSQDVRTLELS